MLEVPIPQIRDAMAKLAVLIETSPHGETYWPIFERLERELASRQDRAERLAKAKSAVRRDCGN